MLTPDGIQLLRPLLPEWLAGDDPTSFEWFAERVTLAAPDNHEAWAMRADACLQMGMAPIAAELYGRAADLAPSALESEYRAKATAAKTTFVSNMEAANAQLNQLMASSGMADAMQRMGV